MTTIRNEKWIQRKRTLSIVHYVKKWQSKTHTDLVKVDMFCFKAKLHNLGTFTMRKIYKTDFIITLPIAFAIQ